MVDFLENRPGFGQVTEVFRSLLDGPRFIDGEAAAGLLGGGLGIFGLVVFGVVELEAAAVDGFDDMPPVGVLRADARIEVGVDPRSDGFEETELQPAPALAVAAGVSARAGQSGLLAPALDESHSLGEGGFVHEPGGQDVGELQGVGGDG